MRRALVRHWEFEGVDYDKSHEIYHDDAILEFPQSGERFIGKQRFLEWRRQYPAQLQFEVRRITGHGELWVTENLISYDGGPRMFTLNVLQFRRDKVAREFLYVLEGFEAAEWRTLGDPVRSPCVDLAIGLARGRPVRARGRGGSARAAAIGDLRRLTGRYALDRRRPGRGTSGAETRTCLA